MPSAIQTPKRSHGTSGRFSIKKAQARTAGIGTSGTSGVRKARGRSGVICRGDAGEHEDAGPYDHAYPEDHQIQGPRRLP